MLRRTLVSLVTASPSFRWSHAFCMCGGNVVGLSKIFNEPKENLELRFDHGCYIDSPYGSCALSLRLRVDCCARPEIVADIEVIWVAQGGESTEARMCGHRSGAELYFVAG